MTSLDLIGFFGVTILLLAYFLNLNDIVKKESLTYLLMNFLGAGLACFASVLMNYWPFIILEASWTLVSGLGVVFYIQKKKMEINIHGHEIHSMAGRLKFSTVILFFFQ